MCNQMSLLLTVFVVILITLNPTPITSSYLKGQGLNEFCTSDNQCEFRCINFICANQFESDTIPHRRLSALSAVAPAAHMPPNSRTLRNLRDTLTNLDATVTKGGDKQSKESLKNKYTELLTALEQNPGDILVGQKSMPTWEVKNMISENIKCLIQKVDDKAKSSPLRGPKTLSQLLTYIRNPYLEKFTHVGTSVDKFDLNVCNLQLLQYAHDCDEQHILSNFFDLEISLRTLGGMVLLTGGAEKIIAAGEPGKATFLDELLDVIDLVDVIVGKYAGKEGTPIIKSDCFDASFKIREIVEKTKAPQVLDSWHPPMKEKELDVSFAGKNPVATDKSIADRLLAPNQGGRRQPIMPRTAKRKTTHRQEGRRPSTAGEYRWRSSESAETSSKGRSRSSSPIPSFSTSAGGHGATLLLESPMEERKLDGAHVSFAGGNPINLADLLGTTPMMPPMSAGEYRRRSSGSAGISVERTSRSSSPRVSFSTSVGGHEEPRPPPLLMTPMERATQPILQPRQPILQPRQGAQRAVELALPKPEVHVLY